MHMLKLKRFAKTIASSTIIHFYRFTVWLTQYCYYITDQSHKPSPHMSRLSGQVYDQTTFADVCGDPSGPWVWSGRVRVVEFID